MKKKSSIIKWILLSLLVVGGTGAVIAYKMYNKPHRNIAAAEAIKVTGTAIVTAYEANEQQANAQYLDKVLEVSGEVTDLSKNQKGETVITLKGSDMGGLICTLEGTLPVEIKTGSTITLKGICTGYLTDVVLVRCTVQSK